MRPSLRLLTYVLVIPVLVAIDLAVKEWAHISVSSGSYTRLLPGIGLTHGYNPGISFSLFNDFPLGVLVVTGVLTTAVLIWLGLAKERASIVPIGLIGAGAVANFVDRLIHGAVTDIFVIGAPQAPLFTNNLADFWISFGVVAMLLQSVKIGRRSNSAHSYKDAGELAADTPDAPRTDGT